MTDQQSLIQFPCDFPLKIIGKKTDSFANDIIAISEKHFPNLDKNKIIFHESQKGNYIALTIVVHTTSQDELDALYQDLTKHPDIKMVL
ncbi:MAG: DUF493 domain-containing protein [Proteobacteria bacterium]|nr:DUF493 domain-containing protein [Pseudomonadota bacterium]